MPRSVRFLVVLCVGLAAWNNLVVPLLPGRPASSVLANAGAATGLLVAARRAGLTRCELGLDRRRVPSGARWGGAVAAVVAAGYAVVVLLPALRPLLAGAPDGELDGGGGTAAALARTVLGTVLAEELAFRGVLQAAAARVLPLRPATLLACGVFGVWHVRPALGDVAPDDLAADPLGPAAAVLGTCLWTAVAGLLLTWLRLRSGSLLAPVLVHLATNGLGVLAVAAAVRLG